MAQIIICGETYSQNLGDGVIADSVAWLLKEADKGVEVCHIDLSGRTCFSAEKHVAKRHWIYTLHKLLAQFSPYRKLTILPLWYCSKRRKLAKLWRDKINNGDLILIGGGQLLMDNDLDFPLKIRDLVRIASDLNKTIAFHSCGVGKECSRLALFLFEGALFNEGVCWISVRDNGSRDALQAFFPADKFKCNVSLDPAVCASETYGIKANPESNIIGLNITAPNVLSRHADGTKEAFSAKLIRQFWLDLIEVLTSEHRQYVLFTNGQVDDYAFARSIIDSSFAKKSMEQVVLIERPCKPRTLVSHISQCRAIVGHRLHANIIAYSLGIPSVGLIWDKKVDEFGKITGRSCFYLQPTDMDANIVKECIYDAIRVGVDATRLAEHKASILDNVRAMLVSAEITHISSSLMKM